MITLDGHSGECANGVRLSVTTLVMSVLASMSCG